MKRALAGLCAVFALAVAGAQQAGPDRATVAQKAALVERLLHDSPVAHRVRTGASDEARALFAAAEALYTHGQALLARGETAAADRLLTEALWQIGKARELVPTPPAASLEDRVRYAQLTQTVESLAGAYAAYVARLSPMLAEQGDEDLQRVTQAINRARDLAASERYRDAVELLERTQRDLLITQQKLLGVEPIVYDRRFAGVEEEARFELERNRDYERLVPLAVREFKPGPEALARVDREVRRSRALTAQATKQLQAGRPAAALRLLQESTEGLQRALAAAGLVVPQTMPEGASR
jgi:hypothetical protein